MSVKSGRGLLLLSGGNNNNIDKGGIDSEHIFFINLYPIFIGLSQV